MENKASYLWSADPPLGNNIPVASKWELIRRERDVLLFSSNWTQLPDAVLTSAQREAWSNYRQVLQDIEILFIDPDTVIFPDAPTRSNTLTPAQIAARARRRAAIGEAGLATVLKSLTPVQAENYIETNVTNLASAKAVIKIMARMLIAMRDEVWPGLAE
jgi:hypothetical protein